MDFQSLQKLRFFLAIIFPVVGRNLIKPEKADEWFERHPHLKSRLEHLRDSKLGSNLLRVNETFGTGNLTVERLDWSLIPEETAAVLRAGIVVAIIVCILVPVAMWFTWPALSQEAITGVAGSAVAGWSVLLWMMAAALTWGCLLAGTAVANRVVFLPAILIFIYFTGAMTASLPRSWWNIAVSLCAAGAIVLCEARSVNVQAKKTWRGIITCVLTGMITGFIMIAATPACRLFPGRVLVTGLALGVPLGVGLWWCGRRLASYITARGSTPFLLRLDISVAILAGLHLCLTTSLAVRGGILVPAQYLQPMAVQITGYLWPFYYFVGIGVVFKVLRQTTVVNMTVRELVPKRIFHSCRTRASGGCYHGGVERKSCPVANFPACVHAHLRHRCTACRNSLDLESAAPGTDAGVVPVGPAGNLRLRSLEHAAPSPRRRDDGRVLVYDIVHRAWDL